MDLEEKKKSLQITIDDYSEIVKEAKEELEILKDCKQPNTVQLYNGIEEYFTVEKIYGTYEYILGGDGRSQPWSENRTGLIAKIKLKKGIYLSQEQRKIVEDYVISTHKPDHTNFINYGI